MGQFVCRVLPIAPSPYHECVVQRRDPWGLSVRARYYQDLKAKVARVFAENFGAYGVRKVWRQMQRVGFVYVAFVIDVYARHIVG